MIELKAFLHFHMRTYIYIQSGVQTNEWGKYFFMILEILFLILLKGKSRKSFFSTLFSGQALYAKNSERVSRLGKDIKDWNWKYDVNISKCSALTLNASIEYGTQTGWGSRGWPGG